MPDRTANIISNLFYSANQVQKDKKLSGDCGVFRRPSRKIPQFDPSLLLKSVFYRGTLIAQKGAREFVQGNAEERDINGQT